MLHAHVVGLELELCHLADDPVHANGFFFFTHNKCPAD